MYNGGMIPYGQPLKLNEEDDYVESDLSPDEDIGPPVKVLTNEDLYSWLNSQTIPEGTDVVVSPAADVSVIGYPEDSYPESRGVKEIANVVKILKDSMIPCCMMEEAALTYYGSWRIMHEWSICVPTDKLDKATDEFRSRGDIFIPFKPCALTRVDGINHLFPRFKFAGLRLFFILLPSQACHISCEPQNIEFSPNGVPYPKLPVYAQSLLDTGNWVDLEELVDAMNLKAEWGATNLNLNGGPDSEWTRWKAQLLNIEWCDNPTLDNSKRSVWDGLVTAESKKRRQGWKYQEGFETRYWFEGSIDPRLCQRDYC